MERNRKRHLGKWVFLLILVVITVVVVLNRGWIYDYARGLAYAPSGEMSRIREDLKLTERGKFLFNAAQPKLSESEEFNSQCRGGGTEVAVLGCYAGGNIYVYNITESELDGIRELTTAHELLHTVYARMSDSEKEALRPALEKVYAENKEILEGDLGTYGESERFEELYVRAGTEVARLPEVLEKHYGEIFENQDAVVAYYDKYIGVFRALKAELDALGAELETMSTEIEQKTAEYERESKQLNADIVSFNSCAEVAGCFTEEEFNNKRNTLLTKQGVLEEKYNELTEMISDYNAKVATYNADVLRNEELNTKINSSKKPESVN